MVATVTELYRSRTLSKGEYPSGVRLFLVDAPMDQALLDATTSPADLPRPGDLYPGDGELIVTLRSTERASPTQTVVNTQYTRPTFSWGGVDPDGVGYREESLEFRIATVSTPEVWSRSVVAGNPFGGTLQVNQEFTESWDDVAFSEVVYQVRVIVPSFSAASGATIALATNKLHSFGGAKWLLEGAVGVQNRQTSLTTRTWEYTYSFVTRDTIPAVAAETVIDMGVDIGGYLARPELPMGWKWIVVDADGDGTEPKHILARQVFEDAPVAGSGSLASLPGSPI